MKILDAYNALIERQRKLLVLIGCDLFQPNYRLCNFLLVFMATNAFVYYIVNAYSMFVFSGDIVPFAFCMVTYGIGIQCGDKLYTYMFQKGLVINFHEAIIKFHQENETLSRDIQNEVLKQLKTCHLLMKATGIVYYFTGSICILFPLLMMIFTEEKKLLLFGFVLPGIDYKTSPGYEINICFQLIQVYYVIVGANVSDAFYLMYFMHARMQLTVMIALLRNLNTLIVEDADKLKIEKLFYDIIEKHISHISFTRTMEDRFSNHFLVVTMAISAQILLTAFVLATTTWITGFALVVMAEFQLFVISMLGTLFSVKNDEFIRDIYDIAWYSMEIKHQKSVLLLLQMAQRPIEQSFGGMGILSLETFSEVNKSVYSFLMMFLSFT